MFPRRSLHVNFTISPCKKSSWRLKVRSPVPIICGTYCCMKHLETWKTIQFTLSSEGTLSESLVFLDDHSFRSHRFAIFFFNQWEAPEIPDEMRRRRMNRTFFHYFWAAPRSSSSLIPNIGRATSSLSDAEHFAQPNVPEWKHEGLPLAIHSEVPTATSFIFTLQPFRLANWHLLHEFGWNPSNNQPTNIVGGKQIYHQTNFEMIEVLHALRRSHLSPTKPMLGATTAIASLVRLLCYPRADGSQVLDDNKHSISHRILPSMHAVFTYIYHKIKQM